MNSLSRSDLTKEEYDELLQTIAQEEEEILNRCHQCSYPDILHDYYCEACGVNYPYPIKLNFKEFKNEK